MIPGYTHIHLLLDRSGSMASIRDDTIGGVNAFLRAQREAAGKASLTLVQFDTQDDYEVVADMQDVAVIGDLTAETYVPRAGTPLLDALGRSLANTEAKLAQLGSAAPEKVVFVVVTDGQENSSQEYSKATIQQAIAHKQTQGWQFVFLSADLAAVQEAVDLGVRQDQVMAYAASAQGVSNSFAATSTNVANFRHASSAQAAATLAFTDDQREEALAE